jgi:transcriptional regulator with XRE-family HTH domain
VGKPNPIREFLTSRRARLSPDEVGVRSYGRRRVPGLRREEVAGLAGISVEYYTQLERGNVSGASDDVLEAVTRALQLDDVERSHLFDLVQTARQERGRRAPVAAKIGPYARQVLDAIGGAAAFVRNGRLDILATNPLAAALYADAFADPRRPVNLARFVFLDPASQRFYRAWDPIADQTVGSLRAEAGRDPDDERLRALIGELTMRSDDFAQRWATHDVRQYRSGIQPFHHAAIGDVDLAYEALELVAAPGQTLVVYTAEPGSPAERALCSLAGSSSGDRSAADPAEAPTSS